jgi:hypothetical protein
MAPRGVDHPTRRDPALAAGVLDEHAALGPAVLDLEHARRTHHFAAAVAGGGEEVLVELGAV